MTQQHKLCKKCNEEWPADTAFFYAQPGAAYGLAHCCKACYVEHVRPPGTRRKNPEAEVPARITDALNQLMQNILQQGATA